MESLPPSLRPRSVPLTMMPPPKRAGRSALVLAVAAWVLLAVVFVFRRELGDEVAVSESWRELMRRVLLGASGILALLSVVPAANGLRRTPALSGFSIFLAIAWLGVMAWRLFG